MVFTKKIDRAFQWAGERMGGEQHTQVSDDFKALEVEMALRFKGMEKLQRSMSAYVKWLSCKGEVFGPDKDKGTPITHLGRTMAAHGDDFEPDSEFGSCLAALGRINEQLAVHQDRLAFSATESWLASLDRSLAMLKEYQSARKKLESRRLAYDASLSKVSKLKREDFRLEEELRANKAKYDESNEDVLRRMMDIKEAERDCVADMTGFLDAELEYHEACVMELRKVRQAWPRMGSGSGRLGLSTNAGVTERSRGGSLSRVNTTSSFASLARSISRSTTFEDKDTTTVALPIHSSSSRLSLHSVASSVPDMPTRPGNLSRSSTMQSMYSEPGKRPAPAPPGATASAPVVPSAAALRGQLRPVNPPLSTRSNVFGDDQQTVSTGSSSRSGSPEWGERAAETTSPATSFGSLGNRGRSDSAASVNGFANTMERRKAPPPPPPSRSKKPPPPVPARRPDMLG